MPIAIKNDKADLSSEKQTEKLASMIQRSFLSGKEQTECINLFDYYLKIFGYHNTMI